MVDESKFTIYSAIPRNEILAYFHECHYHTKIEGKFRVGQDITIQVKKTLTSAHSRFGIMHTPVIFRGPKEKIEKLRDQFRMHFLRAGG